MHECINAKSILLLTTNIFLLKNFSARPDWSELRKGSQKY